jgi:hypothetical protein
VEIANVEAALEKVRGFVDLLDQNEGLWNSNSTEYPRWRETNSQIHEQLPLILRIAARAVPELPATSTAGWL